MTSKQFWSQTTGNNACYDTKPLAEMLPAPNIRQSSYCCVLASFAFYGYYEFFKISALGLF